MHVTQNCLDGSLTSCTNKYFFLSFHVRTKTEIRLEKMVLKVEKMILIKVAAVEGVDLEGVATVAAGADLKGVGTVMVDSKGVETVAVDLKGAETVAADSEEVEEVAVDSEVVEIVGVGLIEAIKVDSIKGTVLIINHHKIKKLNLIKLC